nr:Transposase domain containing protein [Haemonchus contortus]
MREIGKSKKLDKWVPHETSGELKNRRFEISSALLLRHKNDSFLDRIVTCDEKWMLSATLWTVVGQWPSSVTFSEVETAVEGDGSSVVVKAGLIHHSFLDPRETITAERYRQNIDEMHRKLQPMSPELVNRKGPIDEDPHDNARPHVAQTTLEKLNELGYETLPHPLYSADLAPYCQARYSTLRELSFGYATTAPDK